MGTDHMPGPSRLLRIREVLRLCGMSRATRHREIKLHNFPAPVKMSAWSVGWLQEDVAQWLDVRIAQRDRPTTLRRPGIWMRRTTALLQRSRSLSPPEGK